MSRAYQQLPPSPFRSEEERRGQRSRRALPGICCVVSRCPPNVFFLFGIDRWPSLTYKARRVVLLDLWYNQIALKISLEGCDGPSAGRRSHRPHARKGVADDRSRRFPCSPRDESRQGNRATSAPRLQRNQECVEPLFRIRPRD